MPVGVYREECALRSHSKELYQKGGLVNIFAWRIDGGRTAGKHVFFDVETTSCALESFCSFEME